MADDPMYHNGMRQLQDARETRSLADRLEQVTVRTTFTDEDRAFIQHCPMFFIATADAHGGFNSDLQSREARLCYLSSVCGGCPFRMVKLRTDHQTSQDQTNSLYRRARL